MQGSGTYNISAICLCLWGRARSGCREPQPRIAECCRLSTGTSSVACLNTTNPPGMSLIDVHPPYRRELRAFSVCLYLPPGLPACLDSLSRIILFALEPFRSLFRSLSQHRQPSRQPPSHSAPKPRAAAMPSTSFKTADPYRYQNGFNSHHE